MLNAIRKFFCLAALIVFAACASPMRFFKQGGPRLKAAVDTVITVRNHAKLMIVAVEIEGDTYDFLFDTGAPMVIDKALVSRLELKALEELKVVDSQGQSSKLKLVRIPSLRLGGVDFDGLAGIEADLSANPLLECLNIQGIVGANLMRHLYWQLDPAQAKIRLSSEWSRLLPGDSLPVTLPFRNKNTFTPVVTVAVNGQEILGITFDTGSGGTLSIDPENYQGDYRDSLSAVYYGINSGGLFGNSTDSLFIRPVAFQFGTDSLQAFPLDIEGGKGGLLGMRYLENYRVWLNWDQQIIGLKRLQTFSAFDRVDFGYAPMIKDNLLIVGRISARLQKKYPQLHYGDTITGLDTRGLERINVPQYCEILAMLRKGEAHMLAIKGKGRFYIEQRPLFAITQNLP